jgi:hypothetical protein
VISKAGAELAIAPMLIGTIPTALLARRLGQGDEIALLVFVLLTTALFIASARQAQRTFRPSLAGIAARIRTVTSRSIHDHAPGTRAPNAPVLLGNVLVLDWFLRHSAHRPIAFGSVVSSLDKIQGNGVDENLRQLLNDINRNVAK